MEYKIDSWKIERKFKKYAVVPLTNKEVNLVSEKNFDKKKLSQLVLDTRSLLNHTNQKTSYLQRTRIKSFINFTYAPSCDLDYLDNHPKSP